MAEIIRFEPRKPDQRRNNSIVQKLVNGKLVDCINVDVMTPSQQLAYLDSFPPETN